MFSEADRIRVGEAVTRAEARSDGEIVTIVAPASDRYGDVVTAWAALAPLLTLAVIAAFPAVFLRLLDRIAGGWDAWTPGELLSILLGVLVAKALVWRWLLGLPALRRRLIPGAVATRRVRSRARLLFRLSVESRTRAATGVLLYLSLAERRAEIVAEAGIAAKVPPEAWGDAMAALIGAVKDGRPGDGMVASVDKIGHLLATHFPRSPDDRNELPDRLILL